MEAKSRLYDNLRCFDIAMRRHLYLWICRFTASALTGDSVFIQQPTSASTMDGSERARLLRDTWVMIQDVRPDEKVGRIALSDAEGAVSLLKDRQFRYTCVGKECSGNGERSIE
jgi:hypothetical protein